MPKSNVTSTDQSDVEEITPFHKSERGTETEPLVQNGKGSENELLRLKNKGNKKTEKYKTGKKR